MQAGFGEVVVTPPLGTGMAGYFQERLAEGILDDLYSRALVVSQGDTHVALVVTDLICLPMDDIEAVRRQITARTGIPGTHVIIAATHTHTGPVTVARPGFHRDEDYMRTWARLTAGAVELAFRNRVEVTIGAAKGSLPGVSFNRRFRMKNGHVHTNPGIGNPDIVEPAGPCDTDVTVVRFDGPDGQPIGVLTNFACHPDTLGGNQFSGDWVGVAAAKLRQLLGPPSGRLGVVVLNGACGDINHINVNDPKRRRRWPSATHEIGLGVAAESARVAASIATAPFDQVSAASTTFTVQRIPVDELVKQSEAAIQNPKVGSMERRRAQANLEYAEFFRKDALEVSCEVTCLRFGPVVIMSAPGEYSCEFGLQFKAASPLPFSMVANLANGFFGYIPPATAYEEGGYESRSARLKPGSGEQILSAGISLANKLSTR